MCGRSGRSFGIGRWGSPAVSAFSLPSFPESHGEYMVDPKAWQLVRRRWFFCVFSLQSGKYSQKNINLSTNESFSTFFLFISTLLNRRMLCWILTRVYTKKTIELNGLNRFLEGKTEACYACASIYVQNPQKLLPEMQLSSNSDRNRCEDDDPGVILFLFFFSPLPSLYATFFLSLLHHASLCRSIHTSLSLSLPPWTPHSPHLAVHRIFDPQQHMSIEASILS